MNEPETNYRNKSISDLYRGIFKKGYQPRVNVVTDENGYLLADSYSICNRQKNFFNQMLNVYRVCDITQIDTHTAEPLVPDPSLVELETATEEFKKDKSLGTDQIWAKLI